MVIDFNSLSLSIESIWQGVFIATFPSFSNFLISDNVCCAPLNSSLLCINVIFENFESSKAQSRAESPPPKIEMFLFLKKSLFFTA